MGTSPDSWRLPAGKSGNLLAFRSSIYWQRTGRWPPNAAPLGHLQSKHSFISTFILITIYDIFFTFIITSWTKNDDRLTADQEFHTTNGCRPNAIGGPIYLQNMILPSRHRENGLGIQSQNLDSWVISPWFKGNVTCTLPFVICRGGRRKKKKALRSGLMKSRAGTGE